MNDEQKPHPFNKLVDPIAALLCDLWEYSSDPANPIPPNTMPNIIDLDRAKAFWQGCLDALTNDPAWAGGKHAGDCTNQPMTCMRCFVKDKRDEAVSLINAMDKLGYLCRDCSEQDPRL